jgi:hypothetical protein
MSQSEKTRQLVSILGFLTGRSSDYQYGMVPAWYGPSIASLKVCR